MAGLSMIQVVTSLLAIVSLVSSELNHIALSEHCGTYALGKCLSLAEFANSANKSVDNTLTLVILPGEHILTQYISITGVNNVTLIGSKSQSSLVKYEGSSGFILSNISTLRIANLNMSRHGQTVLNISAVETVIIENCQIIGNDMKKHSILNSAVIITDVSSVIINESHFLKNHKHNVVPYIRGAVLVMVNINSVYIEKSHFHHNQVTGLQAIEGGAIYLQNATWVTILNCTMTNNTAVCYGCDSETFVRGGALLSLETHQLKIISSIFVTNKATSTVLQNDAGYGGAIYCEAGLITISGCQYTDNEASSGGSIYVRSGALSSSQSLYKNNFAYNAGGAVHIEGNSMSSSNDHYISNTARFGGGVHTVVCTVYMKIVYFFNNLASIQGAAIHHTNKLFDISECVVSGNQAYQGSVVYTNSAKFSSRDCTFSNNNGSFLAVNTQTDFSGSSVFSNNTGNLGGAITIIQSTVVFVDSATVTIAGNRAIKGGGISLSESQLNIFSCSVNITGNTAMDSGGGMYAYQSRVLFATEEKTMIIKDNRAISMEGFGGGGCFIASILEIFPGLVEFSNNIGVHGGALSLEQNSKVYSFKSVYYYSFTSGSHIGKVKFSDNSAKYGGAIYISDSTADGSICERNSQINNKQTHSQTECFLQILYLPEKSNPYYNTTTSFTNNTASKQGNDLYGGLFDRCSLSPFAEPSLQNYTGLQYLTALATFDDQRGINLSRTDLRDHITSEAVQVCFCMDNNTYDCTVMQHEISVKRGGAFSVKVTAVDQIQNQVDSTVIAVFSFNSSIGRFKEEQTKKVITNVCTELEYNVYSEKSWLKIDLYADGPCGDKGLSKRVLNVKFLLCDCPIGFQPSESKTECICDCDKELEGNIASCSFESETIQLSTNAWIGYVNESTNNTGFIIYPNCPFDYCLEKPVNISLNVPNGADMQCAYNRSNLLCGECEEGLSLVLGTSRCKPCTNYYLALLLPFAILGIVLVAFILILNMTVATGTIHGLIFYANLVSATQSAFPLSQEARTTMTFISWLNLDLGIETCFYNGMNSYAKALLQLVFPSYLIFLTIMIIVVCEYSQRFATLLGNKNPVATLSTLILLSYFKLLHSVIMVLQYTYLDYPDGSKEIVWLYDANVPYFETSHIPRFIIGSIVIVLGAIYTILLFFGQWLPRLSNKKLMKWTQYPKYNAFIDAYHAPFSPKHRYWVGLLLFARIIHSLVGALTTEVSIMLLSIGCISLFLTLLKLMNTRTYKNWTLDMIENSFLINLTVLSLGMYHVRESKGDHLVLISISTSIALLIFLAILCYHIYKYFLKGTRLCEKLTQIVSKRRANSQANQLAPILEEQDSDDDTSITGPTAEANRYHNYTGSDSTTSLEDPHFHDPPIIRSALILDQLREPALDILDPVTTDHYREAWRRPPAPAPRPVTRTVVDRPSH